MITITKVDSPGLFAAKIMFVVIIANAIGVILFALGRKRGKIRNS